VLQESKELSENKAAQFVGADYGRDGQRIKKVYNTVRALDASKKPPKWDNVQFCSKAVTQVALGKNATKI